jgi:hypothetical protein
MLGRKTLVRHMLFHVTILNHTKITLDSKVLFFCNMEKVLLILILIHNLG